MIFQLSTSTKLWGFRVDLEIIHFNTLESLIQCFKNHIIYTLKLYNLEVLIEDVKYLNLHIHGCTTLEDLRKHVLTLKNERIVYICDHV